MFPEGSEKPPALHNVHRWATLDSTVTGVKTPRIEPRVETIAHLQLQAGRHPLYCRIVLFFRNIWYQQ